MNKTLTLSQLAEELKGKRRHIVSPHCSAPLTPREFAADCPEMMVTVVGRRITTPSESTSTTSDRQIGYIILK